MKTATILILTLISCAAFAGDWMYVKHWPWVWSEEQGWVQLEIPQIQIAENFTINKEGFSFEFAQTRSQLWHDDELFRSEFSLTDTSNDGFIGLFNDIGGPKTIHIFNDPNTAVVISANPTHGGFVDVSDDYRVDGNIGITDTKTWTDQEGTTHTVEIKGGIITSWQED